MLKDFQEIVQPYQEQLATYYPEVIILPSAEEVDKFAANKLLEQISRKPNSVLTLPTGVTPKGMYDLLIKAHQKLKIDYSQITIFNLDEYYPIQSDHPSSYTRYMAETFYRYVNIPSSQRHIPNGEAVSPHEEAKTYELLLKQHGPVDMAVLGIGPGHTCHIGFNEQSSAQDSRVRYVVLTEETLQANSALFANPHETPKGAITQGVANILASQTIMLLAKGETKTWGIQRALTGSIGSDAPASFLRYHPNVTFVLDREAAKLLE